MLIGIAGKAGAGKDTAARFLIDKRDMYSVPFALSFKRAFRTMFDWPIYNWDDRIWKEKVQPEWGFSPRQAAQTIGTEWRNVIDPTKMLWCKLVEKYCTDTRISLSQVVIPDVRFEHEQEWIHKNGGMVWYIERNNTLVVNPHISENSLDIHNVDKIFHNDGTILDLYHSIGNYLKENGI